MEKENQQVKTITEPNKTEQVASPTTPVSKKNQPNKLLIIALVSFIVVVVLLIAVIAVLALLAKNSPVPVVPTPTASPTETAAPTETIPLVSPTEIPTDSLGKSKISIAALAKPEASTVLNIFKVAQKNQDAQYYKLGSLKTGKIINDQGAQVVDLTGYDYIFVVYSTEDQGEQSYYPDYLRAFVKKGDPKIYVTGSTTNYSSSDFPAFDAADFSSSVVDVSDYTENIIQAIIDPLYNQATPGTDTSSPTFKSIQNNIYKGLEELLPFVFDANVYYKVDNILGTDIYLSKTHKDMSFYKAYDNTMFHLPYLPLPENNQSEVADITWNNGQKNIDSYQYSAIGNCFVPFLELSNLPLSSLNVAGKDSLGGNIYEPKDVANPDINNYYKVYIETEIYKYNNPKADDVTPFTKTQYLANHAVFYWQDPFGRLIKFANYDYMTVGGCGKPAIYLYPTKPTSLHVSVNVNGKMTFSRPVYQSGGWNVTASPDGKIRNLSDGQIYDYLWWEGSSNTSYSPTTGFVVERSQLSAKLQQYLSQMGLNAKEISDFQEYWLPKMLSSQEQYFFLNFLQNKQVEKIATIDYSVKPDSEIRIFMVYKPLAKKLVLPEQKLQSNERRGFVAVEWGGAKL